MKNKIKKISFIMSFIILFNFISTNIVISYAAGSPSSYGSEYGGSISSAQNELVNIKSDTVSQIASRMDRNGETIISYVHSSTYGAANKNYIVFSVTESGVYHLSCKHPDGSAMKYTISELPNGTNNINYANRLGLAAQLNEENDGYVLMSKNDGTYGVDVLLEPGTVYMMQITDPLNVDSDNEYWTEPVNMQIYHRKAVQTANVMNTNLNSGMLSNQELNSTIPAGTYSNKPYSTLEYKADEIEGAKASMGVQAPEDEEFEKGLILEAILVDLILSFGGIVLWMCETILGLSTGLTLDKIIFNRIPELVVDLTPFGGYPLPGSGASVSSNGPFKAIAQQVSQVYSGIKSVALLVYIVVLLYIGIRILMSVGTEKQSSYPKYLSYWFTGVLLLTLIPYFLPILPYISNVLVESLSANANRGLGQYSMKEIAEALGEEYVGEDAEAVNLSKKLKEKIEDADKQLESYKGSSIPDLDAAKANVEKQISAATAALKDEEKVVAQDGLNQRIEDAIDYVYDNAIGWNFINNGTFEGKLNDIQQFVFDNNALFRENSDYKGTLVNNLFVSQNIPGGPTILAPLKSVSADVRADISDAFMNYLNSVTAANLAKGTNISRAKEYVFDTLADNGFGPNSAEYQAVNKEMQTYYEYAKSFYNKGAYEGYKKAFEDYRYATIKEKRDLYEQMSNQIALDPMIRLKVLAKEQSRVVYAVAWIILVFQLFKVLFMYFKRIIVILILVCLFPAVMAIYAIDKLGDGQSQSLQNWFKEFFANVVIQFLHALVYIVVVNIGIDMCVAKPELYWPFLIISICALFPVENMLRGILNLNAITVGRLAYNIASVVIGASAAARLFKGGFYAASSTAKRTKSTADEIREKGYKQYKEEQKKKKEEEEKKAKEAKQKLREAREQEKQFKEERDSYYINRGRDSMNNKLRSGINDSRNSRMRLAYEAARGGITSAKHAALNAPGVAAVKVGRAASSAASKVANSRVGSVAIKGVKTTGKAFKSAGAKVGNATGKVANKVGLTPERRAKMAENALKTAAVIGKGARSAARNLPGAIKTGARVYRGIAGVSAGAVKAMETLGSTGSLGNALNDASMISKEFGGFKSSSDHKKEYEKVSKEVEEKNASKVVTNTEETSEAKTQNPTQQQVNTVDAKTDRKEETEEITSSTVEENKNVENTNSSEPKTNTIPGTVNEDINITGDNSGIKKAPEEQIKDPKLEEKVDKFGRRIVKETNTEIKVDDPTKK